MNQEVFFSWLNSIDITLWIRSDPLLWKHEKFGYNLGAKFTYLLRRYDWIHRAGMGEDNILTFGLLQVTYQSNSNLTLVNGSYPWKLLTPFFFWWWFVNQLVKKCGSTSGEMIIWANPHHHHHHHHRHSQKTHLSIALWKKNLVSGVSFVLFVELTPLWKLTCWTWKSLKFEIRKISWTIHSSMCSVQNVKSWWLVYSDPYVICWLIIYIYIYISGKYNPHSLLNHKLLISNRILKGPGWWFPESSLRFPIFPPESLGFPSYPLPFDPAPLKNPYK